MKSLPCGWCRSMQSMRLAGEADVKPLVDAARVAAAPPPLLDPSTLGRGKRARAQPDSAAAPRAVPAARARESGKVEHAKRARMGGPALPLPATPAHGQPNAGTTAIERACDMDGLPPTQTEPAPDGQPGIDGLDARQQHCTVALSKPAAPGASPCVQLAVAAAAAPAAEQLAPASGGAAPRMKPRGAAPSGLACATRHSSVRQTRSKAAK
jgi:hypothetical protein